MKILAASTFLILTTGVAQAQVSTADSESFLATGVIAPMYGYPIGTLDSGATPKVGETMQFEYTVGPGSFVTPFGLSDIGVTSIAYSIDGGKFFPDNANYQIFGSTNNFTLFPGNGAEISVSPTSMLVYDLSGAGAYANLSSLKEIGPTSAPEIDPAGLAGGLTLLVGGLLVINGRRVCDKEKQRLSLGI